MQILRRELGALRDEEIGEVESGEGARMRVLRLLYRRRNALSSCYIIRSSRDLTQELFVSPVLRYLAR